MAPADKERINTGINKFLSAKRKEAGESMDGALQKKRKQDALPKLSSKDWLQCMQNSFEAGRGSGLEDWLVEERAWDDDEGENEAEPGMCVFLCDQHQVQWCAIYYLIYQRRGAFLGLNGPIHRRNNDCDRACVAAGFYTTHLSDMLIGNISYGPWHGRKFWHEICDQAKDAVLALDEHSPLLIKMWPAICKDRGWVEDKDTNSAARTRWLKDLPLSRDFSTIGPRSSTGRWMSIHKQGMYRDKNYHTKLFVLILYAVGKGWETSWAALMERHRRIQKPPPTSSASSGTSKGDPEKGKPGPSIAALSASAKSTTKQSLYKGAVNGLHGAIRIMASPDHIDKSRIKMLLFEPLHREHSSTIVDMKGQSESMQFYIDMAKGLWLDPLKKSIKALHDLRGLWRAGFVVDSSEADLAGLTLQSARVQADDALAASAWRLLSNILHQRCGSMARHTFTYPFVLAMVGSSQEAERKKGMELFHKDWHAFAEAKNSATVSMQRLAARSCLHVRAMEDTARMARKDAWKPTERIINRCREIFSGFGQEKIVEDALQKCRLQEERRSGQKMVKQWRVFELPSAAGLIKQYGREEVVPDETPIQVDGTGDAIFNHTGKFDNVSFDSIRTADGWQTWDAQSVKVQSAEVALLRWARASGQWAKIDEVWRAALIPPRQCILCRAKKIFPHGRWDFLLCVRYAGGGIGLEGACDWQQLHVFGPASFRVGVALRH
ncbi:unnamed protein product [Prorocentrum cordatum]|uniref:Uncharacterized protein n=1 Tax=Prorocentrum cordatum TaxID=2364126 RepID=A0ABN9RKK8_9DINO|nr:unnamed protein product [Polarella glacialis]